MILAAGLGTRLRPLTEHIPKPLIPVAGRPLLENILVNLRAAGVREIAINTHHLAGQVRDFVKRLADPSGIVLFHEPRILGVGGGLVNAREFLSRSPYFLQHNGDALTDLDIEALCREHEESRAWVTLALKDSAAINNVLVSAEGLLLDILPMGTGWSGDRGRLLGYMSIGAFSPRIFDYLPKKGPSSLTDAVVRVAKEHPGKVRAHFPKKETYWNTLENLQGYRIAHEDILVRKALRLRGIDTSGGPVLAVPGSEVSPKAVLRGFASIGRDCRVEAGAELEDCVLLRGGVAKGGAKYRQAVLGRDFCISQETVFVSGREIVKRRGYGPGLQISPLVEQGSDRQFFRLTDGRRSEILMLCPADDPDFARYMEIGRFLQARDLGVPEVFSVDEREWCVLLEDLGDDILYLLAREGDLVFMEGLYRKVIELLVSMQVRASRDLAACPAAGERALDYHQLRWETNYFRDNFLHRLIGMGPDATAALEPEFHALAEIVAGHAQTFIHRDFQSQNILMKRGRARIVDFQGARRGPLTYDLASLLRDPYVCLPKALRDSLTEDYRLALADAGGPRLPKEQLSELFLQAGLQRSMQAVGAYCFLWLVKGKPQFRQFIRPGLAQIEDELASMQTLPRLADLVAKARETLESSEDALIRSVV
ncbi:MAG: phosphotransferase [Elusimicrobiota bacterium]